MVGLLSFTMFRRNNDVADCLDVLYEIGMCKADCVQPWNFIKLWRLLALSLYHPQVARAYCTYFDSDFIFSGNPVTSGGLFWGLGALWIQTEYTLDTKPVGCLKSGSDLTFN